MFGIMYSQKANVSVFILPYYTFCIQGGKPVSSSENNYIKKERNYRKKKKEKSGKKWEKGKRKAIYLLTYYILDSILL